MADGEHEDQCKESFKECMASRKARIISAINANPNATTREIAKQERVSHTAVENLKRDRGKTLPKTPPTTKASEIRKALVADPEKANCQIAKELGCERAQVWRQRKNLERAAAIKSHNTNVSTFLKKTDETLQMFLVYLNQLHGGMPAEVIEVMLSPAVWHEESARDQIMKDLNAIKETINLIQAKFNSRPNLKIVS